MRGGEEEFSCSSNVSLHKGMAGKKTGQSGPHRTWPLHKAWTYNFQNFEKEMLCKPSVCGFFILVVQQTKTLALGNVGKTRKIT